MKTEKIYYYVDTWVNGNISEFKTFIKKANKLDILNAVEYYSGNYGSRHVIITQMRHYLSNPSTSN